MLGIRNLAKPKNVLTVEINEKNELFSKPITCLFALPERTLLNFKDIVF